MVELKTAESDINTALAHSFSIHIELLSAEAVFLKLLIFFLSTYLKTLDILNDDNEI